MKCYINNKAALKMKYYVNSVDAEISGVGKTKMIGDDILVEDVMIFKQKCTGSHTDLDIEDEMKTMYERDKNGESSKDWNLWWHSHDNMGVFWSGTDEDNIANQANGGGFLLSIVTNKKGEYKTRFDIYPKDVSPLKIATYHKVEDDIDTIILSDEESLDKILSLENKIKKVEEQISSLEKDISSEHKEELDFIEDKLFKFEYAVERLKEKQEKIEKEIKDKKEKKTEELEDKQEKLEEKYKELKLKEPDDQDDIKKEIEKEVKDKVEVKNFKLTKKDYSGLEEYYEKLTEEDRMYEGIAYGNYDNQSFQEEINIVEKINDIKDSADIENENKYLDYHNKYHKY